MKDFSCHLGKIKLVNEKRLSYIEVDTPRVRICLFPELSLQKEKKQQLHQLVAPFAKSGEKLIVMGSCRDWRKYPNLRDSRNCALFYHRIIPSIFSIIIFLVLTFDIFQLRTSVRDHR